MDAACARHLRFDGYIVDPLNARLISPAGNVALRPKSFAVLYHLVARAGTLVTKEELLDAVWPAVVVGDDSLVQCVREIRQALHDDAQAIIRTVPRRGYVFTRPVSALPTAAPAAAAPAPASAQRRNHWRAVLAAGCAALAAVAGLVAVGHWSATPPSWPANASGASTAAPRLTIAMLPLRNLSGDSDQDYLAEALTDDLTTDLSRVPGSLVIARASVSSYRGRENEAQRIGSELGVRYLLRGSVRRLDEQVRLNLQLVDARTGQQLWAERFDADRLRLSTLQRQVTSTLARTLQLRMLEAEAGRSLRERPAHPDAQDLVMRGWYLWTLNRPASVAQARELLTQAVALDPRSDHAWALLNFTYVSDLGNNWMQLRGHPRAEWLALAAQAADRAYALNPDGYLALGARSATLMLQGQLEQSMAMREKQIAINPNNPIPLHNLAVCNLLLGRPDEVSALEQAALRVSPHDPKAHQMRGIVALAALHAQHYPQALHWAEDAVASNPEYAAGHSYVAAAAAQLGDQARAQAAMKEFRRLLPGHSIQTFRDEHISSRPAYLAGQEHYYEGLRRAGLPD